MLHLPKYITYLSLEELNLWISSKDIYWMYGRRFEAPLFVIVGVPGELGSRSDNLVFHSVSIAQGKESVMQSRISLSHWNSLTYNELLNFLHSTSFTKVGWFKSIFSTADVASTIDGVYDSFWRCENLYSMEKKSFVSTMVKLKNKNIIFEEAIAHILLTILHNYTLHRPINERCDSTNGRTFGKYMDNSYEHASIEIEKILVKSNRAKRMIEFHNSLENLRFITCGERGLEPFHLHDLLTAYDGMSWICITIVVLSVSKLLSCLAEAGSFTHCLISIIKVLVEQGDPFANRLMRRESFRWITVGVLIAAIVLSNGYKNENVYDIISNRNRLMFRTFDQLQAAQVKTFTNAKNVKYSFSSSYITQGIQKGLENKTIENERVTVNPISLYKGHLTRFQVGNYLEVYASDDFADFDPIEISNSSDTKSLWLYTKLHDKTHELLLRPVRKFMEAISKHQTFDLNMDEESYDSKQLQLMYLEEQENFIIGTIGNCENSAFLLDEFKCQHYTDLLRRISYLVWKFDTS